MNMFIIETPRTCASQKRIMCSFSLAFVFCRIGTEHEKLGYYKDSRRRIDYGTIEQLLEGVCDRHGWEPIMEGGNIIGAARDGQSVTIEPGGQFELSGAPVRSLQDTHAEVQQHLEQVFVIVYSCGKQWIIACIHLLSQYGRFVTARCSSSYTFDGLAEPEPGQHHLSSISFFRN